MTPSLNHLEQKEHPAVILRCIAGSRAYGTHHSKSDTDIRGVFMVPQHAYLGMKPPPTQVSDAKGDIVYYTLRRLLDLAAQANPNILELLYTPSDCILKCQPLGQMLLEKRALFVTQKVQDTYVGYARAQIKKASGQNKWVNRPQPKQVPQREDFCWVLAQNNQPSGAKQQPVPLKSVLPAGKSCFLTNINRFPSLYRLHTTEEKGDFHLFKNGKIWCQPNAGAIKNKTELGLFYFNSADFEQAKRDHKHYWHWVEHRNQLRWQTQEAGLVDYDVKNMMHTFRLLLSGIHILEHGAPLVRFEGQQLAFLKQILAGHFEFAELCEKAEVLVKKVTQQKQSKALKSAVDLKDVDQLLRELTRTWEVEYANGDS